MNELELGATIDIRKFGYRFLDQPVIVGGLALRGTVCANTGTIVGKFHLGGFMMAETGSIKTIEASRLENFLRSEFLRSN